jgi:hypothetical protein
MKLSESQSFSFLPIFRRKPSKVFVVLRNSIEQFEVEAAAADRQWTVVAARILAESVLEKEFAIGRDQIGLVDLLALIFIDAVEGARVLKLDDGAERVEDLLHADIDAGARQPQRVGEIFALRGGGRRAGIGPGTIVVLAIFEADARIEADIQPVNAVELRIGLAEIAHIGRDVGLRLEAIAARRRVIALLVLGLFLVGLRLSVAALAGVGRLGVSRLGVGRLGVGLASLGLLVLFRRRLGGDRRRRGFLLRNRAERGRRNGRDDRPPGDGRHQ